uniref:Uncharacterized protein n=1 Tax=viral metagenome TaxID=1070528 RepID=A0A6C0JN67_9ZZZZ
MTYLVFGIFLILLGMYVMPRSLKMVTTYTGYALTAYGLYYMMTRGTSPTLTIRSPRGVSV